MKETFFKLGFCLKDKLELRISRDKFVDILQNNMDPKSDRIHFGTQKMTFGRSNNDYNGLISGNQFKLNQNFYAFDNKYNHSTITGLINETDDGILLNLSTNSIQIREIIFLIVGTLLFLIGLIRLPFVDNFDSEAFLIPLAGIGMWIFTWFYCNKDSRVALDRVKRNLINFKNKTQANNGEHEEPL